MNNIDKSFINGLKWWFALVAILLMGYVLVAEAEEIEPYWEGNNPAGMHNMNVYECESFDTSTGELYTDGLYYMMVYDCELFDPATGKILPDDSAIKCKIYKYKNGIPIREATPDEIEEERDRTDVLI